MNTQTKQVISEDSMILAVIKKRAFGFDVMQKPEYAGRQFIEMSIDTGIENLKVTSTNVNEYIVVVDRKSALSASAKAQLESDWEMFCINNYVRKTSAGTGDPKVASIDAQNHAQQALYLVNLSPSDELIMRFVSPLENIGASRSTQPCDNRSEVVANKELASKGELEFDSPDEYKELTTLTYADQDTEFFAPVPCEGIVVRTKAGMGNDKQSDLMIWNDKEDKFYLLGFSYVKGIKVGDVEREAKVECIEIDAMWISETVKTALKHRLAEGDI